MPFYNAVNDAIGRANGALSQLYGYNNNANPRSEPNNSIRNNARLTIDPSYYELNNESQQAYWEGVPGYKVNDAQRASEFIREATYDLSDRSSSAGQPPNVPMAQMHIQQALGLLQQARW